MSGIYNPFSCSVQNRIFEYVLLVHYGFQLSHIADLFLGHFPHVLLVNLEDTFVCVILFMFSGFLAANPQVPKEYLELLVLLPLLLKSFHYRHALLQSASFLLICVIKIFIVQVSNSGFYLW